MKCKALVAIFPKASSRICLGIRVCHDILRSCTLKRYALLHVLTFLRYAVSCVMNAGTPAAVTDSAAAFMAFGGGPPFRPESTESIKSIRLAFTVVLYLSSCVQSKISSKCWGWNNTVSHELRGKCIGGGIAHVRSIRRRHHPHIVSSPLLLAAIGTAALSHDRLHSTPKGRR